MRSVVVWFVVLLSMSLPVQADVKTSNYVELKSEQPSATPQLKLFFWYGCEACKQLAPMLDRLKAEKPGLVITQVPSQLNSDWYWAAKAFYCAQQLPDSNALQTALYHADWQTIDNHPALVNWFVEQGVAEQQIHSLVYSAMINQQLGSDDQAASRYPLKGVPSIVINQHYLVDASMADSPDAMLELVDQLLRQDAMRSEEKALIDALSQENLSIVSDS